MRARLADPVFSRLEVDIRVLQATRDITVGFRIEPRKEHVLAGRQSRRDEWPDIDFIRQRRKEKDCGCLPPQLLCLQAGSGLRSGQSFLFWRDSAQEFTYLLPKPSLGCIGSRVCRFHCRAFGSEVLAAAC